MNLELALTVNCADMSCQVRLVRSDEVIQTKYSDLVHDWIRIEPQQLVAIDTSPQILEIIWRWVKAIVIEVNDSSIGIKGGSGKVDYASREAELPINLSIGDEVWFCSTDQTLEVHDLIVEGKPTHPRWLLEYITPITERVYAS